nr:NUDIX domain-containing protein [Acinetobacter sp. Marseille-Q1620]
MNSIIQKAPLIGVGIMILDDQGQILLGSRIKQDEPQTWCFPGGKIEARESLEASAVRELLEETGLDLSLSIDQLQPFVSFIDTFSEQINITTGIFIHLENSSLKQNIKITEPHIFESWQWFPLNQLPQPLFPATEVMIEVWENKPISNRWKVYRIEKTSV